MPLPHPRPRRRLLAPALVALISLASACADDGDDTDDAAPAPSTTGATTTTTSQPACSAAEVDPDRAPAAGLPDEVAAMRADILEAARACDYERLAELALAGDFTYSFGGGEDPAAFWRQAEAAGQRPLAVLVRLLSLPHAAREVEGTTQYLWPRAYVHADWADVPEAEREELRQFYDEHQLSEFATFGSYVGYRVGITAAGDWAFYVSGD